jgi:hypothetical protein
MLVLVPLVSVISAWPPRPGQVEWRFEQFGSLVNALPPMTLGLAILMYVAGELEHPRVLRSLGVLALLAFSILVLLLGNFGLDAAQLSSRVEPGEKVRYAATVLRLLVQTVFVLGAVGLLGIAALRASRQLYHARRRVAGAAEPAAMLMRRPASVSAHD